MDEKTHGIAVLANLAKYGAATPRQTQGDPHIKHAVLRELYAKLVGRVYDWAARHASPPRVLDLGAGAGSATLPFLHLGARVTAVDISDTQLSELHAKCVHSDRLEVRCQDVFEALKSIQSEGRRYDVVVASSLLHHIPDYCALIRQSLEVLWLHGQFLSFQDPLRYDSIGRLGHTFGRLAHLSWRLRQGDVVGGTKRFIRRSRGRYLDDCLKDHDEYHVVRGGVDQDAIRTLLEREGFDCEIVRYFSTHIGLWQFIGTTLGIENTFSVLARRIARSPDDGT